MERTETPPGRRFTVWVIVGLASIIMHGLGILFLETLAERLTPDLEQGRSTPIPLVVELPEPEREEKQQEVPLTGQIVDVAPKAEPPPEDADFLAEHERSAERETRTEQYRVNPEVIDDVYSTDDELQFEDLTNVDAVEPSTGAQVGNDRFDPDEDGSLAALPSPFQVTNKDGLQKPVPASHRASLISGAPNNDRFDLDAADKLALNANKIRFANYLNRIRRLVNFYWSQQLHNDPGPARAQLTKPSYETAVFVILSSDGKLESIEVQRSSGSTYMDGAVIRAFEIASPFPEPPPPLIANDGRVYLPNFDFTVTMGRPSAAFQGIDPRAGVQFPGILKLNR